MAETQLTIGHGSTLSLGALVESALVYTSIDGTLSISFGSSKVDTVDNTELATAGIDRVYQSGLRNPGDITAKLNVRPGNTSQQSLLTAWQTNPGGTDGSGLPFKAALPPVAGSVPTGGTATFKAIITSLDEELPDDKKPTYSLKLQVVGSIAWA